MRVPMLLYPGFVATEPKPRTFSCGAQTFTTSLSGSENVFMTDDGYCVIPCFGPMMKGLGGWGYADQSEMRGLVRQAKNDPSVKGIMFLIDSPGGSVSGTADLADEIKAADAVKPCMAYAEDLCASAAMWIASATRKVFSNSSAIVGSIGVRTELWDASKYYEQMGIKVIPIVTGAFKAAGDSSQPITEEVKDYFQEQIDALGEQFFSAVAAGRGISVKSIREMEAKVFIAAEANEKGLVDAVMSLDSAMSILAKEAKKTEKIRMNNARAALALLD